MISSTTRAQPCACAASMMLAAWTIDSASRSSFATISPSPWPEASSCNASCRLALMYLPLAPSSARCSTVQPRRAASASMADRCASRPFRLSACSSVLTRE
ncbi:Uncharacterised protein [Mycobacteroides abscessus subsp. abscessus]|nr:Uncharacterised protein [Mycobacteroides abscessus subsp. abscessus]